MEEITELTIQISVGDFFSSWEEAEMQLNQYAKTTGFTLRRKRTEVAGEHLNVVNHSRKCPRTPPKNFW